MIRSTIALCSYFSFGVRLGIETTESLVRYLPSPLLPCARVDNSGAPEVVLTLREKKSRGSQTLYEVGEKGGDAQVESSIENAVRALETNAHRFVAATSRDYVFVHAGTVGWRGKAILVPGRSFSGKSNLVVALLKSGATYYSDEYAVIDRQGQVHSFNRLPRLRPDADARLARLMEEAGFKDCDAPAPLPLGMVLKTSYRKTARWRPQSMTPGRTLLTLLENTVAVRSQAEFTVQALTRALSGAYGIQSDRREALEAADSILALSTRTTRS